MITKVINTDAQYREALAEVERLVSMDPKKGTPEADRLALIATLVEVYENKHYHFDLPDPIEAIRFRMEEQGLLQRDLVPYLGSKSKVSEVLSGKRPLTIQMIRALHVGLGIPAEVLLQEPTQKRCEIVKDVEWDRFPIEELINRGWIKTRIRNIKENSNELMNIFLAPLGGKLPQQALCRRTLHEMDVYALIAWAARVLIRAKEIQHLVKYESSVMTKDFIKEVARLSWSERGPLLAQEFLAKNGIALVIEPQLPHTRLDGAAMLGDEGPVIGLSLRHDRLDSFWFTLIHELVHIAKHIKSTNVIYIDDLDSKFDDPIEKEADSMCGEILIPQKKWKTSRANLQKTPSAVNDLARELGIHPAIVAGKIRYEYNNYSILSDLVGHKQVRKLFPDIHWR